VLLSLLLYVVFAWLNSYTHHGEKLDLPDVTHLSLDEATKILTDNGLRYTVEDSVFAEDVMPGMVVSQVPKPFFTDPKTGEQEVYKVKERRTVYLTINKLRPPKVIFPNLVGSSKRIANIRLSALGLDVTLEYKSNNTCNDCVLEQLYNGRTIKAGEKIDRGSKVTIVLGKTSTRTVNIPDVIGLKLVNAQRKLNNKSLNVGRISGNCGDCKTKFDTLNAYIVKQNPGSSKSLNQGDAVDLQISREEP